MHHYPMHIGDYQKDTAWCSMIEDCAYRRLLDHYYATEQKLPKEIRKLHNICRATTAAEKKAVETVVSNFFTETESGYSNSRCDEVIAGYQGLSERNRENGHRGGRPVGSRNKKPTGFSLGSPVGSQTVSQVVSQAEPKPNPEKRQPETINHKPEPENTNTPPNPQRGLSLRDEVLARWNSIDGVSHAKSMTASRAKALASRSKEPAWVENWQAAAEKVAASSFCRGGGSTGWVADLDWFLRPDTVMKILEGKYDDRPANSGHGGVDLFAGVRQSREIIDQFEGRQAGLFLESGDSNDA